MAKRYGLRLVFPGAPPTNHVVPGVPGYFNTETPTPVGDEGEIPLDEAKQFAKDKGDVLELVEIKDVKAAEEHAATSLIEGRTGIVAAAQTEDPGRVADEREALKEAS